MESCYRPSSKSCTELMPLPISDRKMSLQWTPKVIKPPIVLRCMDGSGSLTASTISFCYCRSATNVILESSSLIGSRMASICCCLFLSPGDEKASLANSLLEHFLAIGRCSHLFLVFGRLFAAAGALECPILVAQRL